MEADPESAFVGGAGDELVFLLTVDGGQLSVPLHALRVSLKQARDALLKSFLLILHGGTAFI